MKINFRLFVMSIMLLLFVVHGNLGAKTRNIMLVFDINDFEAETKGAVEQFFNHALTSDDQVMIVTPTKQLYSFSKETLKNSKEQIMLKVNEALRKHTTIAGSDFSTVYNQMEDIVKLIEDDQNVGYSARITSYLIDYEANRKQLYNIRMVDQTMLLNLAEIYKKAKGNPDNQIYLFFEKELRPIPSKETMEILRANRDIAFRAVEVFLEEKVKMKIDLKKVVKELKKANVKFNLVYINPKVHKHYKFRKVENSGDFYDSMSKLVSETGGIKITTSQPRTIFEEK